MGKKRVYEVVNNNPNKKALTLGKETYRYGKNGVFTVKDASVGQEIQKQYGDMDAVVNEVEMSTNIEPGHKYTFSGVDVSYLKDSGRGRFVWVRFGRIQKLVRKEEAEREGYEIVSQKRSKRRMVAEVT